MANIPWLRAVLKDNADCLDKPKTLEVPYCYYKLVSNYCSKNTCFFIPVVYFRAVISAGYYWDTATHHL
jgi:hypothetical protein